MRLFEEFLQKKLADFRMLESFRPEPSKEEIVSHNEIEITIEVSEDTEVKEPKPVDEKKESAPAPEDLIITIDSDVLE